MAKAVQWLLCAYLTLKFIQYFFVGRPGFRHAEPSLREKLLRGEPVLFVVACAISVPAALWSSWYLQRGYERGFEHSTDCYERLSALRNLAEIENTFDALRVYRFGLTAEIAALLAAQSLELTPAHVDEVLAEKSSRYNEHYSALSRQGDRTKISDQASAIERCMSEPLISL